MENGNCEKKNHWPRTLGVGLSGASRDVLRDSHKLLAAAFALWAIC